MFIDQLIKNSIEATIKIRDNYDKYAQLIRYLFWGIMAVVFNLTIFFMLDYVNLMVVYSNSIAFFLTIVFAYFTNSIFVFRQNIQLQKFIHFVVARITMILVDNGLLLLLLSFNVDKLITKLIVNIVVIVINYIISKFFVFRD